MDISTSTSVLQIVLCAGLALFVIISNPRSVTNWLFSTGMGALVLIAMGDEIAASPAWDALKWRKLSFAGEGLFPLAWLLFSVRYGGATRRVARYLTFTVAASLLVFIVVILIKPVGEIMYSADVNTENRLYIEPLGYYFYLFVVACSLLALVRLEGILWASAGSTRWRVKYSILGIGGLIGVFIYYYSQPILYRSISLGLVSVRNAITVVSSILLAAAFIRQRSLDVEVFVSRKVVFPSAALFLVGAYFLILGIMGEGMRYFGEDFSRKLIIVLGFVGVMGFAALLLAEGVRRRAKRFIIDNFYRHRYEYKDEWLKFTEHLAEVNTTDEVLRELLAIMVDTFGVSRACYWLFDEGVNCLRLSRCSGETTTGIGKYLPIGRALLNSLRSGCVYDRNNPDRDIEQDLETIDAFEDILVLVPVATRERLIGVISLGRSLAGFSHDAEDYDLMLTFSRQGAFAIEKTRLSLALAEARELEAMGKVTSFVMHDLKNMNTSLSMLLKNAEHHIDNAEFRRDMLDTIQSSVERMSRVINKLSHLRSVPEVRKVRQDLVGLIGDVIQSLAFPKEVKVNLQKPDGPIAFLGDASSMRGVFVNLFLNAVEAMNGHGQIAVKIAVDGDFTCVKISDNGPGIPPEFQEEHLFKPFRTTKTGGLGIGLYHCRSVVEAHGGRITAESMAGKGAVFSVCLPSA